MSEKLQKINLPALLLRGDSFLPLREPPIIATTFPNILAMFTPPYLKSIVFTVDDKGVDFALKQSRYFDSVDSCVCLLIPRTRLSSGGSNIFGVDTLGVVTDDIKVCVGFNVFPHYILGSGSNLTRGSFYLPLNLVSNISFSEELPSYLASEEQKLVKDFYDARAESSAFARHGY